VPQIVEILGCNHQSVHNWFNPFEAQGPAGLYDQPRSGRPVIERIWKYIKAASLANFDFGNKDTIRPAITEVFDELNRSPKSDLTLRFRDPLSKNIVKGA